MKKNLFKSKKLWIGVGIGVAVLAVALGVVYIANEGVPYRRSDNLADAKVGNLERKIAELENQIAAESNNQSEKSAASVPDYSQSKPEGLFVGSILRCDDNLRLRARENTDSSIITTMNAHTKVKILRIGRADESEDVESNWVLVEILPGGKDRDGKRIPDGTAGWCFGGFLEPCPED